MPLKPIIQGLAAIWLVMFAVSFVALRAVDSGDTGDDFAASLNRVVGFLTWQVVAFAVAAAGTLATRHAIARGHANVKLVGYTPLAVSVFVIAVFIILIALRVLLIPMLESAGLL